MSDDPTFQLAKVMLASKYDWPEWFLTLRVAAQIRLVWEHINPDAPNCDYFERLPKAPERPTRPPVGDNEALAIY